MTERKANHIQKIFMSGAPGRNAQDVQIYCPFPVKSIRFVSMCTDAKLNTDTGYIASSIPGAPILCLVDVVSGNKSFEYVFAQPQIISGSYSVEMRTTDGVLYVFPGAQSFIIMLEFLQE